MKEHLIIPFNPEEKVKQRFKITSPLETILAAIHSLEDETKLSTPDFKRLVDLCFDLISRLPLPIHVLQDTFVLRARENKKGEVFSRKGEISYNPHTDPIEQGRFNLAHEQAFYAAVPLSSRNSNGQLTSIVEPCKELFNSRSKCRTKYFTIGKWFLTRPVNVVMLTFFEAAQRKNSHIEKLNPHYLDFLSKSCISTDVEKCAEFYSFFSGYAARKQKSDDKYLLTTAFFHALKMYYGEELGILYSSSMTDNNGLNLVFSKEVIDHGTLELDGAAMFKATRHCNNRKAFTIIPCSDYAAADRNDKFRFKYIL
jgi:hypothetical protein